VLYLESELTGFQHAFMPAKGRGDRVTTFTLHSGSGPLERRSGLPVGPGSDGKITRGGGPEARAAGWFRAWRSGGHVRCWVCRVMPAQAWVAWWGRVHVLWWIRGVTFWPVLG